MRIVLDTNVVLSALLWRGMPYRLLDAIRSRGEARLFTSPALLDELADVLTRPSATKRLAVIGKAAREALPPWRWSRSTDRRRAATNNTSANRGGIEYPHPVQLPSPMAWLQSKVPAL